MKAEVLAYRPETLSSEGLRGFFADVFATLDARPRPLEIRIDVPDAAGLAIGFADGNPVFGTLAADFRRRWIAEHPVPLVLKAGRTARLKFVPADGNRAHVTVP